MARDFKFKSTDLVYVNWFGFKKCKIKERCYEYKDGQNYGCPVENHSYKLEVIGEDTENIIGFPEYIAEDRLFQSEKEAANEFLREAGFTLRF